MVATRILPAILILSGGVLSLSHAADWPQWRGPGRDGVALEVQTPATWPEKLQKVWSVPVGEGHSSPVVAGGRVYIHTREGDDEVVRAMRLSDGSMLWRRSWPVPYEMHSAAVGHGKGPKATPALARGTLYTFGIGGALAALDAETGDVRWRREFTGVFKKTSPLYGTSSSPLVEGDLLIAYVGGHHEGSLVALDEKTGRTRWSLDGQGPGYASPIVGTLGGRRQIVTQGDQNIIGVSTDAGQLLWKLPLQTPWDQNAVTAVIFEGMMIVSGLEHGLRAYAFDTKDGALTPREVWNRPDASLYLSSPVVAGGRLFGFSHVKQGQFFALDLRTGQPFWASDGRQGENAALVAAGPVLLALTDSATLYVLATTGTAFTPLAKYTVADTPTWAHPVPTDRGLLIKDRTHLALWSWGAP